MSETPGAGGGVAEYGKPLGENAFLRFVQRPRIMLGLLAAWAIVGVLTEFFTSNGIFFDNHDREIDGAIAGRALAWQGLALAALYIYCARDPMRYRGVFWIALIEQGAAIAANLYHLGNNDYSLESIIIPVGVAIGLAVLVLLHLFQPGDQQESRV
jgi:hypothetical protein